MNKFLTKPGAIVLSVSMLIAFLISSISLDPSYVALPDFVKLFDDLHNREVVDAARYMYKGVAFGVVYGIINKVNHKLYVGSTSDTATRFYEHLISGQNSNAALQSAIGHYGLHCFSLVIFELFHLPQGVKANVRLLFGLEQKYLDMFPAKQKYNFASKADGGNRPMTQEEKDAVSKRMMGVNKGRAPVNKGVPVSSVMLAVMRKASAHRYHTVYIYDDMDNLVTMYPSISEAVRVEKTQKNKFMAHIKNGTR